jgi:hypothetical protein
MKEFHKKTFSVIIFHKNNGNKNKSREKLTKLSLKRQKPEMKNLIWFTNSQN